MSGRPRSSRRPGQQGSATVVCVALVAALGLTAVLVAVVAGAVVAQRRVESSADLAALAGAAAVQQGGDGCAAAGMIARRNSARLARCMSQGGVVTVHVTSTAQPFSGPLLGPLLGRRFVLGSSARAGPSRAGP